MKLNIQNAYTGLYKFSIATVPAGNFVRSSNFHELMSECIRTLSRATSKSFYNENHPYLYPGCFQFATIAGRTPVEKLMRYKMLHCSGHECWLI